MQEDNFERQSLDERKASINVYLAETLREDIIRDLKAMLTSPFFPENIKTALRANPVIMQAVEEYDHRQVNAP